MPIFKLILTIFHNTVLALGVFVVSLYSVPLMQKFWENSGIIDTAYDLIVKENNYQKYAVIADVKLNIAIADSEEDRIKGLSGEKSLELNEGMFFIFEEVDNHGIWMKDMNFPIDIIWFDQTKRVVHIEEYVTPETYPNVFKPKAKSKYVLEVPAGFVKKNGIKIYDWISIL